MFYKVKPKDNKEYYRLLGLFGTKRVWRWIEKKYMTSRYSENNIDAFKVFIPKANGSGTFGEQLSQPVIGKPGDSATPTFLSIGKFSTLEEATNCSKYIKTKMVRALLGVLKITQDNPPSKWSYIPFEDFTEKSDINWFYSISEIDKQLYKKYGISEEQILFIENTVKEMK